MDYHDKFKENKRDKMQQLRITMLLRTSNHALLTEFNRILDLVSEKMRLHSILFYQ